MSDPGARDLTYNGRLMVNRKAEEMTGTEDDWFQHNKLRALLHPQSQHAPDLADVMVVQGALLLLPQHELNELADGMVEGQGSGWSPPPPPT